MNPDALDDLMQVEIPFGLAKEVVNALERNKPIVGLETSVVAQGLPMPQNLEAADQMANAAKSKGAVAAFVGVIDGGIRVGLDGKTLRRLASGKSVVKLARRDLAVAAALGEIGGTTVSATVHVCAQSGIDVVATGGIGGVHPGAASSFDISEDITVLAETSILLVCSGAKSILDLPATLELLETRGVVVLGYRTDEFPAFYDASSGLRVQRRVDDAATAAQVLLAAREIGQPGAVMLAVPPPADTAIPQRELADLIRTAEAETIVSGAARTPALLAALARLSDGRTVRTNLALLQQNARIAAEVARALVAEG